MKEVIPGPLDGERVDRVVALLTGLARAEVARLVEEGAVRVDGRSVATRSRRVGAGETLEVDVPAVTLPAAPAGDASIDVPVVYADDHIIVVDKPAGLVVHPGAGNPDRTLVHGLLARFPDLAGLATGEAGASDRPGIVHRLDKGTSGLLVVARTAAARDALVGQLATRAMTRRYAALVWGLVDADEGLIDAPIQRAEADPTRMAVRTGGREARTRYRVERRLSVPIEATLVDCSLETGRTHQIRVHLAAIGHPVVGDARYGRRSVAWPRGLPRLAPARPWLHARELSFDHPATGHRVTFSSPLPADLEDVLSGLS
jgi:23S rRNA pseudouridine1911/1915/1917 synthase